MLLYIFLNREKQDSDKRERKKENKPQPLLIDSNYTKANLVDNATVVNPARIRSPSLNKYLIKSCLAYLSV